MASSFIILPVSASPESRLGVTWAFALAWSFSRVPVFKALDVS